MPLDRRDILAARACRVVLSDRRYSRARTRALIGWLNSDFPPTADIAGRALEVLGSQAFDDILQDTLACGNLPRPGVVWALELFPERHERLLPLLRQWLTQATGQLRLQVAVSITHILTRRLQRNLPADRDDVARVEQVLRPIGNQGAIRVHLRDFDRAVTGSHDQ